MGPPVHPVVPPPAASGPQSAPGVKAHWSPSLSKTILFFLLGNKILWQHPKTLSDSSRGPASRAPTPASLAPPLPSLEFGHVAWVALHGSGP